MTPQLVAQPTALLPAEKNPETVQAKKTTSPYRGQMPIYIYNTQPQLIREGKKLIFARSGFGDALKMFLRTYACFRM